MSRRDTIIVAVLVNAGLLMILFATAVRSDEKKAAPQLVEAQVLKPRDRVAVKEPLIDQFSVPTLGATASEELVFEDLVLPEPPVDVSVAVEEVVPVAPLVEVKVQSGDYLEKIAKNHHTTVTAIMDVNGLRSSQLKIGQVLKIPGSHGQVAVQQEEYYVVKEGDNPWLIASRNHLKLHELLRLNGLDEQKARRIRPGDRLRIR